MYLLCRRGFVAGSTVDRSKAEAKGTDVGEYPMGLKDNQFSSTNDNYDVTFSVKVAEGCTPGTSYSSADLVRMVPVPSVLTVQV